MSKTKVFAGLVLVLILGTYYFEFYSPKKDEEKKDEEKKGETARNINSVLFIRD